MKQDLRVTVTKRMIQEALLRLLENDRIEKVKISQLCEEAGINRATFYRHYETLQDTLNEIKTDLIDAMPHPSKPPRDIDELRRYMVEICSYMYSHADVLKILFANRTDEDMMQTALESYQYVLENHKDLIPEQYYSEDTITIMLALVGGGCQCLLKHWILGNIQKTPEELADIMCQLVQLRGMLPL